MRLLIVDDVKEYRELLLAVLTKVVDQLEIVQAEDGRQAIEILRQAEPFDLIISDFTMPVTNGAGVFRFVREHGIKVPFILFSAMSQHNPADFTGSSFLGAVSKHNLDELTAMVRQVAQKPAPTA
jgi:CheY-like chemotaxis protein